ncbi:MAG: FAD:protein FMN transferase [Actinobacteria bacterium]|nr:FAD:protein FMN transferase [Cyanobacteriota bacterium]MCL5772720.1 FAD:protein FMN transferase [Actinomycetota bacterium]
MEINNKNLKKNKKFFISLIAIVTIIVLTCSFIIGLSSCKSNLKRFEENREKMGTYVNIIIYTDNEQESQKILDMGFAKIDEISKIASNYDKESAVSKLNKDGFIENAPKELVEIIQLSKDYNKITSGAFDITVDPILTLWSKGLWKESKETQQQKISEALKLTGSDKIIIEGNNIKFTQSGMSVTLGGIAKGYIVDKVLEVLKNNGINNTLVNAGGDIATLGAKPDGGLWHISLENPDNTSEKIVEFAFAGKAIATSGNYYRYFDPEKEAAHIIDPRTGYTANKCISSTIIADNATIADILATAVFVLGPEDGMNLVNSLDNVEALIIDSDKNIFKSKGIDKYIVK